MVALPARSYLTRIAAAFEALQLSPGFDEPREGEQMGNRKPHYTGPQRHAEGDHGEKTHRAIIRQLQSRTHEKPKAELLEKERKKAEPTGKRRRPSSP